MDGPYISTCLCAFAMGTIIVHYCRWLPCQWIFPFVSVYKSDLTPPRVSIPEPRHFIVPVSSDDSQSVRRISFRPRQMCHEQLMKLLIKFTGFKPTGILTHAIFLRNGFYCGMFSYLFPLFTQALGWRFLF